MPGTFSFFYNFVSQNISFSKFDQRPKTIMWNLRGSIFYPLFFDVSLVHKTKPENFR